MSLLGNTVDNRLRRLSPRVAFERVGYEQAIMRFVGFARRRRHALNCGMVGNLVGWLYVGQKRELSADLRTVLSEAHLRERHT